MMRTRGQYLKEIDILGHDVTHYDKLALNVKHIGLCLEGLGSLQEGSIP